MENLNDIIFYSLDKAIKSYRQYAQKQLAEAGFDITIDQWLILKAIEEDGSAKQQEIASKVFKDVASVTRIVEMLVKKGLLARSFHESDRRRFKLELTTEGHGIIERLKPYTKANRKKALNGVSNGEVLALQETLVKIISNVTEK